MVSKPGGKGGMGAPKVSQPKSGQAPTSSEGTHSSAGHVFGTHSGGIGSSRKN